jgi:hypothetical protein
MGHAKHGNGGQQLSRERKQAAKRAAQVELEAEAAKQGKTVEQLRQERFVAAQGCSGGPRRIVTVGPSRDDPRIIHRAGIDY